MFHDWIYVTGQNHGVWKITWLLRFDIQPFIKSHPLGVRETTLKKGSSLVTEVKGMLCVLILPRTSLTYSMGNFLIMVRLRNDSYWQWDLESKLTVVSLNFMSYDGLVLDDGWSHCLPLIKLVYTYDNFCVTKIKYIMYNVQIIEFLIITLFACLKVSILLTCGKYLHDCIISNGKAWVHKTSLTLTLCIEVPVSSE